MHVLGRRPTKDHGVHPVSLMRRHIDMEVVHKVLALHALVAPVSNFRREELHDSPKWRQGEERADPGIVYLYL